MHKGHAGSGPAAIMQIEALARAVQRLRHGPEGGDADAPGQQQAAACTRRQPEMVARRADGERLSQLHLLVHADRATARGRLAQHGNAVVVNGGRVVAQRILAHQARSHMHVDMGAGREGRQGLPLGVRQLEAADAFGFCAPAADDDLHCVHGGCGVVAGLSQSPALRWPAGLGK